MSLYVSVLPVLRRLFSSAVVLSSASASLGRRLRVTPGQGAATPTERCWDGLIARRGPERRVSRGRPVLLAPSRMFRAPWEPPLTSPESRAPGSWAPETGTQRDGVHASRQLLSAHKPPFLSVSRMLVTSNVGPASLSRGLGACVRAGSVLREYMLGPVTPTPPSFLPSVSGCWVTFNPLNANCP